MSIVTVSEKGQVAIPMAIRQRLGINPGTQLDFEVEGGQHSHSAYRTDQADASRRRIWAARLY